MKIYRIAIPIPYEDDVKAFEFNMLVDGNDESFDGAKEVDKKYNWDQVWKIEKKFPDAIPIGLGNRGIAYDLGDRILKVTSDGSEFRIAKRLLMNPLASHANVYEVNDRLGYIILEKLRPLNKVEQTFYRRFAAVTCMIREDGELRMDIDRFMGMINKTDGVVGNQIDGGDRGRFIKAFISFVETLKLNGVEFCKSDAHDLNVGFDSGGHLKILDLGDSL